MSWTLRIEEVTPSGNVVKRMHWSVYSKLMERWWWLVRQAPGFTEIPTAYCKRRLIIVRHGVRALDRDNLYGGVKPLVDILRPAKHDEGYFKSGKRIGEYWSRKRIGHGLIKEDDAAHLELEVVQVKLGRGENPHLTLTLFDLPLDDTRRN